jgi:outer membrane lipoprotein-sorting protein
MTEEEKMPQKIGLFAMTLLICLAAFMSGIAFAEDAPLTANEILEKIVFFNQSKDQTANMRMVLIDRNARESVKEMKVWGKGDHLRLIKFILPADIKGTGFLVQDADLPSEKMYVYLSAFKKTKRIAGSAKGESFMDSDFSYSDMGSMNYEESYDPMKLPDEDGMYVLDLAKKKDSAKEYDRLKMWVNTENFVPSRVEFYMEKKTSDDKIMELRKIMTTEKVEKIGELWVPTVIVMEDVKKKHKSRLELSKIEIDKGLGNDVFTERYLERP